MATNFKQDINVTGTINATSFNGDGSGLSGIGGNTLQIKDEGSALPSATAIINFVGSGVTATGTGTEKTITIAGGGGGTLNNIVEDTTPQLGGNLDAQAFDITTTGKILFSNVYSTEGDLPNATTYHGMFAHVHATGAGYFAHGGNWIRLANHADLGGGGSSTIAGLTDVDTTGIANDKILKYNSTSSKWEIADDATSGGGSYSNSDVDTHLNTGTATTNQVLSWTGSDYDWVAQSGGGSTTLDGLTDVSTAGVTNGQVLKYNGASWAPADDSISSGGSLGDITVTGSTMVSSGATITIDDDLVVTGTVSTTAAGAPVLTSASSISLQATTKTIISNTPLQLHGFTTTQRDALTSADGDLIYNSTTDKIDAFLNGSWFSLGTDVVEDTTPQLGGDLDVNGKNISFGDSATPGTDDTLSFGADDDLQVYHNSSDGHNYMQLNDKRLYIKAVDSGLTGPYIIFDHDTSTPSTVDFSTVLAATSRDSAGVSQQIGQVTFGTPNITSGSFRGMMRFDVTGHVGSTSSQGILFLDGQEDEIRIGADINTNGATIAYKFTLGANGSSDYTFSDAGNVWFPTTENDPVLYLRRGEQYVFTNNSGGSHPFEIRVSNGGSAYNTGVTNNGASSGDIIFKVPMSAPATLYYQCTSHSGMGNTINIV